ncbi:MAG TPA: fibronectin type III domain-containing protein, partial [Chitinophagales bacterium]|nr:fibronectin type III domain-containing protein [Chitinophagales bacterium]
ECSVNKSGNYTVRITDANKTVTTQSVNVLPANVSLPGNLRIAEAKQENALVEWNPMPQANAFAVRFRESGAATWSYQRATGGDTNVKLKNLKPGQTYELQAMAYGAVDSSGWSASQTFGTEGPCINANNLRFKIKSGNAWFYWTQNPYCTRQELVIKKKGAGDWERAYKFGAKVNSAVLDNLKNGVEYEWAIRSYCPAGDYNGVKDFTVSEPTVVSLSGGGSGATTAAITP